MLNLEEEQQQAHLQQTEAMGQAIGLTATSSRLIASVSGSIQTGTAVVPAQGEPLDGLTYVSATLSNKANSSSSVTFTLEQVVPTPWGLSVNPIGQPFITLPPSSQSLSFFNPLPVLDPNTGKAVAGSYFRAVVRANATPQGVDYYQLVVSGV